MSLMGADGHAMDEPMGVDSDTTEDMPGPRRDAKLQIQQNAPQLTTAIDAALRPSTREVCSCSRASRSALSSESSDSEELAAAAAAD